MHPIRIGRIVRSLRRRRGWRQLDLASLAAVSQQSVSLIETGQCRRLSLDTLERVLARLEAELEILVRWRGGELDRVMDEGHAVLVNRIVELLRDAGWLVEVEVTYAVGREHGSIDVLAFRDGQATLLIVEVKAEVTSAEGTLRKHDQKVRLGATIARSRFGWDARTVSRLLVAPEGSTSRRRIERHRALFERAYPTRGRSVTTWLRRPVEAISGLLFLPRTKMAGGRGDLTSRRRVRRVPGPPAPDQRARGAIGFPIGDLASVAEHQDPW